ncbi:MAG: hypothetical protein JNL05_03175 [Flavobacteriales bacterium]|nr:hypothetical protein [Flavobacteriales bacterium]
MKRTFIIALAVLAAGGILLVLPSFNDRSAHLGHLYCPLPSDNADDHKGCVFRTVFEGEGLDTSFILRTLDQVFRSEERGLAWLVKAQAADGGFGAGTHARQDIMDPHAVQSDPATTAMVGMALLRMGNTPDKGAYSNVLNRLTDNLLITVEQADNASTNITKLQGTQIQAKLGQNIDVALTAQFLSNLMGRMPCSHPKHDRWLNSLNKCVAIIQRAQNADGSVRGDGWAGVLQSSFAASALESAKFQGAAVNDSALRKAQDYQKANFDVNSGSAVTERAAGITLYAVSGSTRNSAREAREAKDMLDKAKKEGKVAQSAPVSVDALEDAGYTRTEAERLNTAYQVYNTAKVQAQADNVISGFGNNGGEEFLSFLQTGESLVIGKDNGWRDWYAQTSGRLVSIQNNDGSWNGHHCITSPVFCTATSLLILSVNNDIEQLLAQGAVKYR